VSGQFSELITKKLSGSLRPQPRGEQPFLVSDLKPDPFALAVSKPGDGLAEARAEGKHPCSYGSYFVILPYNDIQLPQLPKRIDGTLPKTRRTTSHEKSDYSSLLSAPREALETRLLSQSLQ
jgi:hypothetical protein